MTILAALFGNVLGYTVFKGIVADMYYGSYSLPTYETRWNAEAFLLTTAVPFLIMMIINVVLIYGKTEDLASSLPEKGSGKHQAEKEHASSELSVFSTASGSGF